MVSAVSCGSVAEPFGNSWVRHGAAPHIFPQRSPLKPLCCQNFNRCTQCVHTMYFSCKKLLQNFIFLISFLVLCVCEALDPSLISFSTFHWYRSEASSYPFRPILRKQIIWWDNWWKIMDIPFVLFRGEHFKDNTCTSNFMFGVKSPDICSAIVDTWNARSQRHSLAKRSLRPVVTFLLQWAEGTQAVCLHLLCNNWDSFYLQGSFLHLSFPGFSYNISFV